ncbi:anti-sigma factor family protein [Haloactinopolyspora alba]|uniref:anti-sigma factor family protein n=1 Tax=Haloactinopolyspora alba TaxID=648780 RepID=UPI000D0E2311|nr:hypothetical protein [Haloactinopolyspora alba]
MTLAEYVEGVLDDDSARSTASHVDECPTCRQVVDDLRGVPAALRDLPAEMPVPEHVSARLTAAIAAEHARGSQTHAGDDHGTVAWFRRGVPRAVAAAASIAVLGLAGYIAVGGDGGPDEATTAGSGAESLSESAGENAGSGPGPRVAEDGGSPLDGQMQELEASTVTELEQATRGVWENRTEMAPGCGSALADQVGLELVGSVEHGSGVLVVLENPDAAQLEGRLVSTCGSTTAEALAAPVTVPVP